jgi:GT2 family glycosyltransferase
MRTAIVIPTYNRPEYVTQCYQSLCEMSTMPDHIFIIDDCSTVKMPMLNLPNVTYVSTHKNSGVKYALHCVIDHAFSLGYELIMNLDSDAIVKPDFVDRMVNVHNKSGHIVSGFNNPNRKFISINGDYGIKSNANGINMCFDNKQYLRHMLRSLSGAGKDWDLTLSGNLRQFAITIPSCVQHIGKVSSLGHYPPDEAKDFNGKVDVSTMIEKPIVNNSRFKALKRI